jgi:hypothetical protein
MTDANGSPPYDGEVIQGDLVVTESHDLGVTGFVQPFRASGRFAVNLVGPPNPAAGGLSPIAKVFASGTEVDGAGNPILGLADVRIYNVVPTSGNVTIRGEVVWNGTINVKINLVWFG